MKIKKEKLLEVLKSKCNTDNFNSTSWCINIGFTQKFRGLNYYVSVYDLDNGWIKVNVWQYGKFIFDFEMEVVLNKKRDLWKFQKTLMKAGVFIPLGIVKRFIYAA